MPKQIILVVDDEHDILTMTDMILGQEGYEVVTAENADQAIQQVRNKRPDLILLDLKLPGIGGMEVCRILKEDEKTSQIPIIMLTGKYIKPEERAEGLDMGADDYIIKPFSVKELTARMRAVLRRMDHKSEPEEVIKTNDESIIINLATHTVDIRLHPQENNRKILSLTPKEFDLLYTFVKKRNHVLNRNFLCEYVWGHEYFGTTRTVDVHIAHLREKLGYLGKKIETIEAIGYKFVD